MKLRVQMLTEFIGTAFLLMIIVGSGIMGESLAQGNAAVALLANSLATGAGLFVLIQSLGPISGAHFNPVVSLVEMLWGRLGKVALLSYWIAQLSGAIAGVLVTHVMFDQVVLQLSQRDRSAPHLWVAEVVATFGLIGTIALAGRKNVVLAPLSIAAYIFGAYWFTSSTSFANPAVTVARMITNTFCGISPMSVGPFVIAQFAGAALAFWLVRKLERAT